MKMETKYIKGQIKVNETDDSFSVVASTAVIDRQGESIDQSGWDLSNYMKNPVILWAHDYSLLPVARAESTDVVDDQLVQSGVFASHAFAQEVKNAYREGFLNTVSVGFIPKERNGHVITKAELLEVSFVPVPANPEALSLMRSVKTMTPERKALIELIEKYVELDVAELKEGEPETTPEPATETAPETSENVPETSETADPEPTPAPEPAPETTEEAPAPVEEKVGRVLSNKNRELISSTISAMETSIASLKDLLVATEQPPEKTVSPEQSEREVEAGLVEIPVETLKDLLSQSRRADRHIELSNAVLKRILKNKV